MALTDLTSDRFISPRVDRDDVARLVAALDVLSARHLPAPGAAALGAGSGDPRAPGNVVGIGIGEKIVGGRPTGRPAVVVLVRHKADPERVGKARAVPAALGEVATDVQEMGDIAAAFTARRRPAPGGVSIGNEGAAVSGSLGCLVEVRGRLHILGTNHVMAMSNQSAPGAAILQPSRQAGGSPPHDAIARLTGFVPIDFDEFNEIDAAIAEVAMAGEVEPHVMRSERERAPMTPPHTQPALGMAAQKSGAATGWTRGTVDLVSASLYVGYGGDRLARFDDQFRVSPIAGSFAESGDSGAVVATDPDNAPVGLLFANARGHGFCNDIDCVLTALDAAIHY